MHLGGDIMKLLSNNNFNNNNNNVHNSEPLLFVHN